MEAQPHQIHQHIVCIFCGASAPSKIVIQENGFDGRKCAACSLIFVSPRPSISEIFDLYGHDEAYVSAESHLASGYSKRLYARNSLRLLGKYANSGDILEIGAGAGFFLDEARKRGFKPFAIEFNGIQGRHIQDSLGIPCIAKPLSEDPFPGQAFDIIYHCDVVSHLYDPHAEFRSFHHALRDGGLLVFETGNIGDMNQRYFNLFNRFQYPDHLFFFSSKNIKQLLEKNGFELLEIQRYSIAVDLLTSRIRSKLRSLARRFRGKDHVAGRNSRQAAVASGSDQSPAEASSRKGGLMSWIKSADQYVNYLIRYRLGRYLPKGDRPQTLIVVARKRASIDASSSTTSSK